jgi:uncharacterized Ntn-hydrolase superfamily protein
MSAGPTAHDKLSNLEKRVESLEAGLQETRKKATVIAVIATLLGSGGAAGLIQVWINGRLQHAETALKEQEKTFKSEDQDIKEKLARIDLNSKERDQDIRKQVDKMRTPAVIIRNWKESEGPVLLGQEDSEKIRLARCRA